MLLLLHPLEHLNRISASVLPGAQKNEDHLLLLDDNRERLSDMLQGPLVILITCSRNAGMQRVLPSWSPLYLVMFKGKNWEVIIPNSLEAMMYSSVVLEKLAEVD